MAINNSIKNIDEDESERIIDQLLKEEKRNTRKNSSSKKPSNVNLFDNRIIKLTKTIDADESERIIDQLLKLDTIKSNKDITFYINSPGGSVSDGMAIYDAMQMVKSDIRTVCIGRCSSMAAVLLSGGTKGKRFITPNSEIMIHEVSSFNMGKIGELKINYEHSNTLNERIIKLLSNNTGKSIKQIRKDIQKKDRWFNAEEALKYGLIDKIITKN